MKNKIKYLLVGFIVILTLFLFVYFFLKNRDDKVSSGNSASDQAEIDCKSLEGLADGEIYAKALEALDTKNCSCIKNEIFRQECVSNVTNADLYEKAAKSFDSSVCDSISAEQMKKDCHEGVENSLVEMAKTNPRYVGDALVDAGKLDKAIDFYQNLIDSGTDDPDVIVPLAIIYLNQGKNTEAEKLALSLLEKISGSITLSQEEKNLQTKRVYRLLEEVYYSLGDESKMNQYNEMAEKL